MTGFLNRGPNPLSRLTIATLQDIGYTVDYSTADEYGVDDLNLSVCPLCNGGRRQVRSVGSRQLGVDEGLAKRRELSDNVRIMAIEYGLACLAKNKLPEAVENGLVEYIGDQVMAVLVEDPEEKGAIYSIIVVATQDEE